MTQETAEQRIQRFRELREAAAQEMLQKYPNLEMDRHEYGITVIIYIPSYSNGKIKVNRSKRLIGYTALDLSDRYLTEEDAKIAISLIVPKAEEKYQQILKAFKLLQSSMDCIISYWAEGNDLHGITIGQSIYFEMEGFSFDFELED